MKVFMNSEELKGKDVKWIDARFALNDSSAGRRAYDAEHINGAVYWDLEQDLSDMTKASGRHPMPDKEALTELLRNSGLQLDDEIVVYDDGGSPFAARAWWMLQYAGFTKAFIAADGFDALKKAGFPAGSPSPAPVRSDVTPIWNEQLYASKEFVKDTVQGNTGHVLLDARAAERYRGDMEPLDPVAGHIPGARNFDWEQLKDGQRFRLDDSVKQELASVVKPGEEVAVYCGSGVTASPLYALLKHAGYDNVRLYVGSYSDWISTEDVSTGE